MSRARLEAFSDAVIAIVITIMVLELAVPEASGWPALRPLVSALLTYALSFVFLGIYWNNHHHMLHTVDRINGAVLWSNLHLLFWLSLVPFATRWMGEARFARVPTAAYGSVLLCAALAYLILQAVIIRYQGPDSRLRAAVGRDAKGKLSVALYLLALPLAFVRSWIAVGLFIVVALLWLVPDRRIEAVSRP